MASSRYAHTGEPAPRGPEAPDEVLDLTCEALVRHTPVPALVMDEAEVEEADGRWVPRVVELSSVDSAGFHGCDPAPVAAALPTLAVRRSSSTHVRDRSNAACASVISDPCASAQA